MSSTLVILNAIALTVLVAFHFQTGASDGPGQMAQASGHHMLSQKPQLAVMTPQQPLRSQVSKDAQAPVSSEHWIF